MKDLTLVIASKRLPVHKDFRKSGVLDTFLVGLQLGDLEGCASELEEDVEHGVEEEENGNNGEQEETSERGQVPEVVERVESRQDEVREDRHKLDNHVRFRQICQKPFP